ncbi:MAG TPA: efflux RND transporter permease subunit [Nitrospirae bacterium]|nr:efflux RND transporter permease subunit [Nitrospirota bacterium]
MKKLLRFVIDNPLVMAFAVIVITFTGLYAAIHMPVDLFPNLDIPVVNIITHYPGASPEDMELLITRPIEDEVRGIQGVKRVASSSVQGISRVTVEFTWGTGIRDARQLIQARLARVRNILPPGTLPRIENIGTTLQNVVSYVVYGGQDLITLRNNVRYNLASRLMAIDGVSYVEVLGGDQRAFIVRIRPEKLISLHLTVDDIVKTIRRNNMTAVAGYLDRSSQEYLIRGDARLKTLNDLRSLPVIAKADRSVLLGSVASVSPGAMPRHYVVHGDGVPAVAFIVRKQPGASAIRVASRVNAEVTGLHKLFPPGTRIKKFYDQSEIITEARDSIFYGLLTGAVLAVVVLYFFLGALRLTLIVAATIPVTLIATLALMSVFGLGLNVVTMSALTLAVGLIVDDAIVVSENIFRHRQMGKNEQDAGMDGTIEIAGADASGTFTTVAAFLPLILLTGLAAVFLKPFGLTISAALVVSLLLSLSFIPMAFSMKGITPPGTDFVGARLLRRLDTALHAALQFCFQHRRLTIFIAFLSLSLIGITAFLGSTNLLPPIDEGAILIEYIMPPGTALTESNRIGDALERIALSDPDVTCVYRRTGSPVQGYQIEGVNMGEIMIKLKPKNRRKRSVAEIMDALKREYGRFGGMVFLYHQPTQEKIDESFSGLSALFGVTIYGTDTNRLASLSNEVERIMAGDPAVSNIINNTKVKASGIVVRIKYPQLAQYGVSSVDILNTLRAAGLGVEATRIVRQRENIGVLVKVDFDRPHDIDSIRELPVPTGRGDIIPLDRLADFRIIQVPSSITRLNGQREVTLVSEVEGSIPALVSRLKERFRSIRLPKGYSIDFTGQYKSLMRTARDMVFVVLGAIALIYLIMAMQFRSLLQPLVILTTIPLSMVGASTALFLSGQGLDVSVGMGIVTLAGISVNNAIVLLDYSNKRIAAGETIKEALLSAASVRLRPILMTALTTLFALIPTAVGTTLGSNIFQPFAITVIGGLASGTISTLIVVPVLTTLVPGHAEIIKQQG